MTSWDAFKLELRFDSDALRDELISIEAHRLALNRMILPYEWQRDLQKLYIVRAVHGTTAIEGNPLSEEEVSRQLTAGATQRARDRLHRETANAARAFEWVERNFKTKRDLCLNDLLTLHRLLTTGSDEHDNVPGQLRRSGHNVTVGSPALGGVHRAPAGGGPTEKLVDKFLRFVNSARFRAEHLVIQALIAHFYFVTLHPFGNGNGRTTRCIEAAILFGGGYNTYGFYSLSNYFYRNRDEYFRMLQDTRTQYRYDLTRFLEFGLRGFQEELDRINSYVRNRTHRLLYRELIRRCREIRVTKRRRLLNDREAEILHGILDITTPADPFSTEPAREATSSDLKRLIAKIYHGVTTRTISRELNRLSDLGFIFFERENGDWRIRINFNAIQRY